ARRSSTLKKIDQLYSQAHINYLNEYLLNHPKKDFAFTLARMLTEFDFYLAEHKATSDFRGPDGKDLHRNQLSKGLMKQTYDFIREFLASQKTVPLQDSRHTRAGVLYLLGHTQPSINMWSVASAAVTVGTATASLGTTAAGKAWESQNVGKLKVADPVGKMNAGMQIGIQI